jgi:hypothetical protein
MTYRTDLIGFFFDIRKGVSGIHRHRQQLDPQPLGAAQIVPLHSRAGSDERFFNDPD